MQGRLGKIVLVVIGVILMLVFILPAGLTRLAGSDPAVATLNGQEVHPSDLRRAGNLYQYAAGAIRVPVPQSGQYASLPALLFGPQQAGALEQDPELFYILLQEARNNGISMPDEQVAQVLQQLNAAVFVPDKSSPDGQRLADFEEVTGSQIRQNVLSAAGALLDIARSANDYAGYLKVSEPVLDYHLALEAQQVDLRTVVFDAEQYLDQVKEPGQQALQAQFEQYKDNPAGDVTPDNPFGFGYRLPDRVKFQYITIPQEAVRRQVLGEIAEQSLQQRERTMYAYWSQRRTQFPVPPGSPATQPSTQPTTQPAEEAETPATQPTGINRLLAEENPTVQAFLDEQTQQITGEEGEADWRAYVAVHDDVIRRYVSQQVNDLESSILDRLRSLIGADYRKFDVARSQPASANAEPAQTSVGVPITDPSYLEKVADQLAERFGIRPGVASYAKEFFSREELADAEQVGPIADASLVRMSPQGQPIIDPFANYALGAALPRGGPARAGALRRRGLGLAVYEPSQTIQDLSGNAYIFRLTAAEADKPADQLTQVVQEVRRDVRLKEAYELALADAKDFAHEARQSSLDAAAGPAPMGRPIFDPAPFIPASGQLDATAFGAKPENPNIPATLTPPARVALAQSIYRLLAEPTTRPSTQPAAQASDQPIGVLEIKPAFRAVVAELEDLQGNWPDEQTLALRRQALREQLTQRAIQSADPLAAFFDPDAAAARVGYERLEEE